MFNYQFFKMFKLVGFGLSMHIMLFNNLHHMWRHTYTWTRGETTNKELQIEVRDT